MESVSGCSSIGTLKLLPTDVKPILLSNAVSVMLLLDGSAILILYLDDILSRTGWNENLSTPTISLGVSQFVHSLYFVHLRPKRNWQA